MVLGHRTGNDERAGAVDVRRVVPGNNVNAFRRQVLGILCVTVTSGDGDAAEREELGECGHAGAGDSDEVNWAGVVGVEESHAPINIRSSGGSSPVGRAHSFRRPLRAHVVPGLHRELRALRSRLHERAFPPAIPSKQSREP